MNLHELHKKIGVVSLGLALFVVCGCGTAEDESHMVVLEKEVQQTAYELSTVAIGDVIQTERIRCTYKQLKEQEVSFSLEGKRVNKVYVKVGEKVTKGQLLAELSGGSLNQDIDTMKYRINRLTLELSYITQNEELSISSARVNELFGGYSADEQVKSIQKNAELQRQDKQDELDYCKAKLSQLEAERRASSIYAEMDGIVYKIADRLEGSTSQKDKTVITIIDASECVFEAKEPAYAKYFKEGEVVPMKLTASSVGEYELIPYQMENWGEKQLFSIYNSPTEDGIEVDTSGYITLTIEKRENVLCVNKVAVHTAGDESYVYVIGDNNNREIQWITTGLVGDEMIEIVSGLTEGDKVIAK